MNRDGRPRVFHLITRLLRGGAEAKTVATVTGLDGYEFTVGYGASYEQVQVDRLQRAGVETRRFPLVRHYDPVTAVPAVVSLARYLRAEHFDVVHTHSTEAGIIGRFAAALAGVPHVVHTVHGVPFTDDRSPALNRFVLGCERLAARYTDRIVANADIIAEEYLDRGIGRPKQYTTVYSGVDLDVFENVAPAEDLPGCRPRIVMIARLAEGKGFGVLFDALDSLEAFDGSVCIVGDGPLRNELEREIDARGLSERVFLTGYRDDVPSVLAASDVLVLPSFREGTPRVITEAMASGLPVVATDVAGVPEQVEDGVTGHLVTPGDVEALSNGLSELLSNRERREWMGQQGRERVERFSEEAMLEEIDDLYRSLVSDPSAGNPG